MAPIFDTDVAENRWSSEEWKTYELWEAVERRLERRRTLWIVAAVILHLAFSSIPVITSSYPKWKTLIAARALASRVARLEVQASKAHETRILRIVRDGDTLRPVIERVADCSAQSGVEIERGKSLFGKAGAEYAVLDPQTAAAQSIPGVVSHLCYDPLKGLAGALADPAEAGASLLALALIPVNDLSESRFDRMSVVLVDGKSSAISIK